MSPGGKKGGRFGCVAWALGQRIGLALMLFSFSFPAIAQEGGSVSGVVISTWDGAPLSSVVVTVRGTTLAAQSGADGRYELKNVPGGDQTLRFSKSGFASAVVSDVRVLTGQSTTVNGNLRPEFYEMEEYEVTAEEFTEQTEQILIERQQSSGMMEAIGSEQFSKVGANDAAEALGKVSGASIADGKFAVVRGLADRYTSTTINGTDFPSADPDRKAAQLDLMPAKFIGRIDVNKTFLPDMPGGFAGGAINIVTRTYPEKFEFSLDTGTSYNTQASLRDDYLMTDRGSKDWLAMDDGTRALPKIANATTPSGSPNITDPAFKSSFKSTQFSPVAGSSPLNSSFSLSLGDSREVFGARLGYLAGLTYRNDYKFYDNGRVSAYQPSGDQVVFKRDKQDARSLTEYTWSAMVSLGLQMTEDHEVGFNFMRIQSAEDEARRLVGFEDNYSSPQEGSYIDQSVLHWTERSLTFFQLRGGHQFPELADVKFDWAGSLSTTAQDEPDQRFFQFYALPSESNYNAIQAVPSVPNNPTRLFRDILEDNVNVRADLTIPLPSYNSKDNALKTGAAISQSQREFNSRGFEISRASGNPFETSGDPNEFAIPGNQPTLTYRNVPNNWLYSGEQTIQGTYLMGDWAALEWLRLIGGVRAESTDLKVTSINTTKFNETFEGSIQQTDLLPGVSATVSLRENLLLRLGWSQTVVRPTYREVSRAPIYDIAQDRIISGNEGLILSRSENIDVRLEWYPQPGSLISIGGFLKKIESPIELRGSGTTFYSYTNYTKADVMGVEVELRDNLGNWWNPLEELTIGFNAAYMQSEVPLLDEDRAQRSLGWRDTSTVRSLYDQPEYVANADITWDYKRTATALTIVYGVVGPRLIAAGTASPDDIEEAAPQLDVFLSQKLGRHWKMKLSAKNLLDPEFQVTQKWPAGGKLVTKTYTKGMTFGLSVGCEF
ncbi:MAG: TonB-dependent receptor [Opitutaceae bacterium]|nr:TonB-dependent receptor [Verrucomicrobiales bacterium]